MIKYILKRVAIMLLMIILISTMIFFLFRAMPGDPTAYIIDPSIPAEARAQLMEKYGLDKGKFTQYKIFIGDLVKLDFGDSYFYGEPVMKIIKDRMPATLILMLTAMVFAYAIGIILGSLMAWWRGGKLESISVIIALFFRSAPTFWVGLMMIIIF